MVGAPDRMPSCPISVCHEQDGAVVGSCSGLPFSRRTPFLHRLLEDPPVLLIPHPDPVYRLGGDGHPGGWMSRLRRADSSNLVNIIFIYGSDMLVTWYLL